MTDVQADPYRVSAVFDDGGPYTGTMTNEQDARHRYDLFIGHSDRRPAFVGLFARSDTDGLFHLIRYFSGDQEIVLQETAA